MLQFMPCNGKTLKKKMWKKKSCCASLPVCAFATVLVGTVSWFVHFGMFSPKLALQSSSINVSIFTFFILIGISWKFSCQKPHSSHSLASLIQILVIHTSSLLCSCSINCIIVTDKVLPQRPENIWTMQKMQNLA